MSYFIDSRTPLLQINWDGKPSAKLNFSWKIGYTSSQSSAATIYSMYLRLNPSTVEVLEAITLYCTWSDNQQFQGKLVL